MLLDVHAHPPAMWRMADPEGAVEVYVDAMARYDLRAVVSQLRPGPDAPAELSAWEKPHAGNDYVAKLVRRYPDRLIGYCTTHPGFPRQALAELELRLIEQR